MEAQTKLSSLKKICVLRDGLHHQTDPNTESEVKEAAELYEMLGWPMPQPVLPLQGCGNEEKRNRAQRVLDALKLLNGCFDGNVHPPAEAAARLGLEFLEDQPFPNSGELV